MQCGSTAGGSETSSIKGWRAYGGGGLFHVLAVVSVAVDDASENAVILYIYYLCVVLKNGSFVFIVKRGRAHGIGRPAGFSLM